MRPQPCRAPPGSAQQLRHEEVHRHRHRSIARNLLLPDPDVGRPPEPGGFQTLVEPRLGEKIGRNEGKIRVRRVGRDREVRLAGVEIDRLRPHQDDGGPLLSEGLESVEEHPDVPAHALGGGRGSTRR